MPTKKVTPESRQKAQVVHTGLNALANSGALEQVWRGIDNLWTNRQAAKIAEADAKEAQEEVLPILDGFNVEKITTGTLGVRATVIHGTRMQIDHKKLQRKLGAKRWQAVTTRVPDKAKLEQAIADGVVDAIEVAECTDEVPSTPYIRTDAPRK